LRCIGARSGITWMRSAAWIAHPIKTRVPSRIARIPQNPPVIPGQDMLVKEARVRMNFTTSPIDVFPTKL
jgi:hypothetical protein